MSGVIAGIVVAGSVYSSHRAASAQKKASQLQQKMADVSAARERVQAARQARIARASVLANAGNEGVGGSGVQGATASIGSQYGSNIGNMNVMQDFGQQISAANQKAADWQSTGSAFQAIGGLAGGMTDWKSIFSGQQDWMSAASGTKYNTSPFSQQSLMLANQGK